MNKEAKTDKVEIQQRLQKAEARRKIALKIGYICFPLGLIVFGLFLWFYVGDPIEHGMVCVVVALIGGFVAIIGISSLIAALVIDVRSRYLEQRVMKTDGVSSGGIDDEL